ncbi:hypothetical protein K7W42_16245 [Deinococcus sp. HMF7604]|uniref:hypothetical protein n=1 Tax=Deinococcus betulae TaxID=2873312 RepID=UPI001CCB7BD0|nr:hypothetical protein [Deinococcus betulae]MBZ9752400.1 hypothetical protein [Deinococcus betulae]
MSETPRTDVDPRWYDEFTERLRQLKLRPGTKTISLEQLHAEFTQVFAHRPGIPDRRAWLREALRYAQEQGVINLPAENGQQWDDSGIPRLPKKVTRVRIPKPPRHPWWKTEYWHPQLEWILDLETLDEAHDNFLRKVQQGLMEGWFEDAATLRHRSIQLTGDDKRLGQLLKGSLFKSGQLSSSLLNCASATLPLTHEILDGPPLALVFENEEPYNLALSVLKTLVKRPYGIIAFGGGGNFQRSVLAFADIQKSEAYRQKIGQPLQRIDYVGDLDWPGIAMAARSALKAQGAGLPPVVPAVGAYLAMLNGLDDPRMRINRPDGLAVQENKRHRKTDLAWLPEEIQKRVDPILANNRRVAEEMLTERSLRAWWASL